MWLRAKITRGGPLGKSQQSFTWACFLWGSDEKNIIYHVLKFYTKIYEYGFTNHQPVMIYYNQSFVGGFMVSLMLGRSTSATSTTRQCGCGASISQRCPHSHPLALEFSCSFMKIVLELIFFLSISFPFQNLAYVWRPTSKQNWIQPVEFLHTLQIPVPCSCSFRNDVMTSDITRSYMGLSGLSLRFQSRYDKSDTLRSNLWDPRNSCMHN